LVELPIAASGSAAFPDKLPVRREDLQSVVSAVDNNAVAVFLDRETSRPHQFPVATPHGSPFPQEVATAVEHGNRVSPVIRDVDVVVVVDGNPEGPSALPVAFAVFAKVGDMFFIAGTAKLHFVDMHPEIILVASIGGVEIAVFIETHCLDAIETRAADGVAPDGIAPIVNPSFVDRCERHSAPPLWYTFALEERTV
jgi:hypothetical protein